MKRLTLAVRAFYAILTRDDLPQDIASRWGFQKSELPTYSQHPPAAPSAPGDRSTRDRAKWLLLSLPILLAALNSSWMYSHRGYIDPWFYIGYFLHLGAFKATLFPNLYYGSRLPWILPGYLAYQLPSLTAANYVLHFTFYYAATFAIYFVLKRAFGRKNALLGAILFGTHSAFLASIGWDYVDGAGITYNLLAIASLARASKTRRRGLWLMLAGAAGIAMFYTNLYLAMFLPFQAAFFLFLTNDRSPRRLFTSVLELLAWFGAGAALVTAGLGAINYLLDGNFWFYAPSVNTYLQLRTWQHPWRYDGFAWVLRAYWLGLPAAVAVACLVHTIKALLNRTLAWGDYRTFFVLQYLAAAAVMIVWYLAGAGGVGLQLNYYTSYLIPPMFLAITGLAAIAENQWNSRVFLGLIGATAAIFLLSIWLAGGAPTVMLSRAGLGAAIAVAAMGMLVRVLHPRPWQSVVGVLLGLLFFQLAFPGISPRSDPAPEVWQRVIKSAQAAWPYVESRPTYFWYDESGRYGLDFTSINSFYLWSYSFVGPRFPKIEALSRLRPFATAVLLSEPGEALKTAAQVIQDHHLKIDKVATATIAGGGDSFDLTFLDLADQGGQSMTAVQHGKEYSLSPAASADPQEFPRAGWQLAMYPDGKPRMEQRPDGVLVTTADHRWAYGSWYGPVVPQRAGTYRFTLKYQVISGGISYGGMTADMSRHLGQADTPRSSSRSRVAEYVVKLNAGEGVVLLISNDPPSGAGPSTYLLESLRATAIF
jgi:hypothetical protein